MTEQQAAILRLLNRPFSDGYERRTTQTQHGKPDRFDQLPRLYATFVAWTHAVRDGDRLCD